MKLLIAADNRKSSGETLLRIINSYGKFHNIRIAGYSKSLDKLNADWNIDALLDWTGKSKSINIESSNYALLSREIKRFKPDLIISDLEPYCSSIAIEQGIKLWQVSPTLLYYAIEDRVFINKYYSKNILKSNRYQGFMNYIIRNSDKRLILSHLGDIENAPQLSEEFDWVRPPINNVLSLRASAIALSDIYFGGMKEKSIIDYSDEESILCSKFNDLFLKQKETTINDNVKYLSQFLESSI